MNTFFRLHKTVILLAIVVILLLGLFWAFYLRHSEFYVSLSRVGAVALPECQGPNAKNLDECGGGGGGGVGGAGGGPAPTSPTSPTVTVPPPSGGEDKKNPVVSCPLKASDGKIFKFPNPYRNYIYANQTQAIATKGPFNFSLPAGNYKVTLVGFDDHSRNSGQVQTREQYYVVVKSGSSVVAQSGASADIPENKDYSTKVVNQNLVLSTTTNKISAFHAAHKTAGPHSLAPVCVAFLAL